MRRPRLTIQRWMVALVFVAIALWAATATGPDLVRRWTACRQEAAWHAKIAAGMRATKTLRAKTAASTGMPIRPFSRGWKRKLDYHTTMGRKYHRALYIPWEFYDLGDHISPN